MNNGGLRHAWKNRPPLYFFTPKWLLCAVLSYFLDHNRPYSSPTPRENAPVHPLFALKIMSKLWIFIFFILKSTL